MKLKIATWNLNTWLNRKNKGISNSQLWQWAEDNLAADIVVFTEAETPPPRGVTEGRWSTAHRPFGFPGVSRWGTVIAARTSSNVRVEHITSIGTTDPYEIDTKFPGTLTAADLFIGKACVATVIGLHMRYRKNKDGKFEGHPEDDLDALKKDFEQIRDNRGKPLIIAGDFNFTMDEMPKVLKKLCRGDLALVDTFERQPQATFEQDWGERHWFRLDYMLLSKNLDTKVTHRQGGIPEFPAALEVSDHAPLLVEIDFSDLL